MSVILKEKRTNALYYSIIFCTFFFLDQLSKYKIRINGGFYICNNGVSFGIILPYYVLWLTLGILLFFLLSLFIFEFKKNSKVSTKTISLLLILAGASSNILDRLRFGCVIDFIKMPYNFPLFNIADVFIFIGVLFFLISFEKSVNN